jgi:hypothetical protein
MSKNDNQLVAETCAARKMYIISPIEMIKMKFIIKEPYSKGET